MRTQDFTVWVLSVIVLSMAPPVEAVPAQTCSIANSVYRDLDGKGFELVFGPPKPKTTYYATAVINHSQQRSLYQFRVTQLSGYGSVWLGEESSSRPPYRDRGFWITFFDRNLRSATPLWLGDSNPSPQYAVVAELGSHDHYRRRGSKSPPVIGDVMWIFDRCQS